MQRRPAVKRPGAANSADLGGSSKESSETLVDRSEKGSMNNISWTWMSRS